MGLDDNGACRQDWRRTPKPQSPHVICYNYLQCFSFSGSPSFPVYGYYGPDEGASSRSPAQGRGEELMRWKKTRTSRDRSNDVDRATLI